MSTGGEFPFDRLLALIARAVPPPWYASEFLRDAQADPLILGRALDELRLAGLIAFTPWEKGRGQGLELTALGRDVLNSPRAMARLACGQLPASNQPRYGEAALDDATAFGRGEAVRAALIYRIEPRVTQVLLAINIAVFLIGTVIGAQNGGAILQPEPHALYWTGAVHGLWLLDGQWWRLLTSCFVHIGGIHLLMNMYALWVLGPSVEQLWGRWRYLAIYVLAGLAGSCAAMGFKPQALVAGASGCIWGIMAAQLLWILLNRAHLPRTLAAEWTRRLGTVIIINVVISFTPGISAEAHFGGGLAGAAVAALLHYHRYLRGPLRLLSLAGVILIPLASVVALLWAIDRTSEWHRVKRFHDALMQRQGPAELEEGEGK